MRWRLRRFCFVGAGGERVCVERGLKENGGDEACSHRCKDGGK